ncbi:MAG: amino acid adenylation domain-containing protein, partial [Chloroflexi bacterium]
AQQFVEVLTEDAPLSFAQQRLWFFEQLGAGQSPYNIPSFNRLYGALKLQILEQSVQEIMHRHAIFRTTFINRDGYPVQVIKPTMDLITPIIDLTFLPTFEQEHELSRLMQAEVQRPFELAQGPLLRLTLLRLRPDEHVLLATFHHIIIDGWSQGVFVHELSEFYTAYCNGWAFANGQSLDKRERLSLLPALPLQYADFAKWQREWLQGEVLQQQLDYWRQQLAGAPALLELPTDRPRPAVQTFAGARRSRLLSPDLLLQLKSLSKQEKVTLFMTLLTAFQVLLMRYSGQRDIIVSTPIANRTRKEFEGLIGLFVNTLVLRTDLSGNPTFRQLLDRVQQMAVQAYAHQDIPFEKLVEELQPERNLSYQSLSQVAFILQSFPTSKLELPEVSWRPIGVEQIPSPLDLSLFLTEGEPGLLTTLEYNTDLFDATTMERLLGHWQVLLEAIVHDPGQTIAMLPLLTGAEREQLLVQWNATARDIPSDRCLHQLIEQQVERTPEAIAVVFEETSLTYRELNRQANYLAHRLLGEGVGPDVLVGVCMERSLELVIALLAILKAGGAYLPLDSNLPQQRLAFLLEDAQVAAMLTQPHLCDRLPSTRVRTICLAPASHCEQTDNPQVEVQPENLAYMIYTSGSTGKPKGTMNTHRGICNRLLWMQDTYQLTKRDRVLQKTPFSFDVSVWEFFWPLLAGARLIIARPGGHQDPMYLRTLFVEQQVTTLHFVPSMLQVFLGHESTTAKSNLKNCTSLRQVICSGEVLTPALQARFFASVAEEVKLYNLYGPTEAAIDVTAWQCQRDYGDSTSHLSDGYRVSIGRPIANTQIYLLDAALQPVPISVPGELCIAGVGLARGYLHQPELTAEKFIAHPFGQQAGERIYRTGDLARYRADGAIEFLGRLDQQVKLRGFRIELGEIGAILRTHPAVQEAVVVLHEEDSVGPYLAAYVVGQPAEQLTQQELQGYLRRQLPDYMVPVVFVALETIPLTPNGKVDRHALPVPTRTTQSSQGYVAPQSELERRISGIWQEVLNLAQVGIYDNFFDLGGHSLLLIQVRSKLAAHLGYEMPVVDLFRYPTIHALSTYLSGQQEQQPLLQPIAVRVEKRKTALQKQKRTRERIKR